MIVEQRNKIAKQDESLAKYLETTTRLHQQLKEKDIKITDL